MRREQEVVIRLLPRGEFLHLFINSISIVCLLLAVWVYFHG